MVEEEEIDRSKVTAVTELLFRCGQCELSFRTIKEMMSHVKSVADHEPVCVECNSKFQNFDNLRHHLRKYHLQAREVVCKECGKVSRSEDQQYQHWNYVHKVEPDLWCNLCGVECQNMFKLRQHTKKCLARDPVRLDRERREAEREGRCREQIVTWTYSRYKQYKTNLRSQTEASKKSSGFLHHKRRKVRNESSPNASFVKLSEDGEEEEEEEEVDDDYEDGNIFGKKLKTEDSTEDNGTDVREIDIDELLEVKYEVDSDLEEASEKPLDSNQNNNDMKEIETDDALTRVEEEEEEEEEKEDEEYDENESNVSDDESFQPPDSLQLQREEKEERHEVNTEYRFQCDECRETFRSLSTLKRHRREEHSEEFDESQRRFQCPICPDAFFSEQTLRRHKRKHHPDCKGDPKYNCSECDEKFYRYLNFRDHMKEAHNLMGEEKQERPFKCPTCPDSFLSESSLKRHRRKTHPETLRTVVRRQAEERKVSWPCTECEEVLRSQNTLKRHKKIHHQKKRKCNMCEEMVYNLPQHRREVHPEIMAVTAGAMAANGMCVCPYCSKQIATQQHLESHIKRMHEELLMKTTEEVADFLYCVECGTQYDSARALRLHRKQTHDRHLYVKVCPHCAKEVMNLQKHVRDAHPDPNDDKVWPCKDCDQVFKTSRDLRYHRARLHEKEICPFCGKLATKEHIEYVHRVQPVQCDICLAELKNKRALRNHKNKVHAPAEVLACKDCGQMFDNKIKLYAHNYAVHSYQESKCEWCGGTYKNKKLLQAHKRVMHKDLYVGRDTQIYNPTVKESCNVVDSNLKLD